MRERYRREAERAAGGSLVPLPLNAFHFSSPREAAAILDPSSPVDVGGFVFCLCAGASFQEEPHFRSSLRLMIRGIQCHVNRINYTETRLNE